MGSHSSNGAYEGEFKRTSQEFLSRINQSRSDDKRVNALQAAAHYLVSALMTHPQEPVMRYFSEVSGTLPYMNDRIEIDIYRSALAHLVSRVENAENRTARESSG